MDKILEIKNLTKYYRDKRGIEDLDFYLNPKEIVGFIGPNGSGKSTTIKTILNLIIKNSGNVKIFGKELSKEHKNIMEYVGYCPSNPSYYENMTARKYLMLAASFYEINHEDNIIKLAKKLNLELDQKISEMSDGNRQKVVIINALFHEPKLILLDEPTRTLDPGSTNALFEILKEYKRLGAAILISSHNLNTIQKNCDRVIIIKKGSKIKDLDIKDLHFSHKRVHIMFEDKANIGSLDILGVKDLQIDDKQANFLYVGRINALIKKLSKEDITDITIENPTLDEIFKHFYTD